MQYDSNKESTIELLGITGILTSLACAIQHIFLVAYAYNWMPVILIAVDGFLFTSFIFFYKMKSISVKLLVVSSVLMLLQQGLFLAAGGILWLCCIVTAFTIIVTVLSYIQDLKLYMHELEQEEKNDLFNY